MKNKARKRAMQRAAHVPKWVSVAERLPEKSGNYIVIKCYSKCVGVIEYSARYKEFNASDICPDCRYAIKVSHWMPLPPAPKEG